MTVVAERAGLSQQMVSYIEREMRNPTLDTLLRMAEALKLDPAELLRLASRGGKKSRSGLQLIYPRGDFPAQHVAETDAKD